MEPISDFTIANFISNLKLICSYHGSISEICRKIQINRQQFMKYLSGSSFPSRYTFRKMCDFFGVDEYEMLMPHDQFRNIVRLRPIDNRSKIIIPNAIINVLNNIERQKNVLSKYVGYYYKYYSSFSKPNCILRSLVVIYNWENYTFYKRIERIKLQNDSASPDVYKYAGILTLAGDRLHFIDQESITGHELTHTIIYPSYRNRITTLSGMIMGVSGSDQHLISASPVVLEYIGRGIRLRAAVEGCRICENSVKEVPAPILQALHRSPTVGPAQALQVSPLL